MLDTIYEIAIIEYKYNSGSDSDSKSKSFLGQPIIELIVCVDW